MAARLAFEWPILTASRTGETLGATSSEIDAGARVWEIPKHRMNMRIAHRVPLTDRAMAILEEAAELSDGTGPIFPSPMDEGKPLSNMALSMVLRRIKTGAKTAEGEDEYYSARTTANGFRSSFSTWARENSRYRIDTIEAALAHREKDGVARAYASKVDYWRERCDLGDRWTAFCTTLPSTKVEGLVIPIRKKVTAT